MAVSHWDSFQEEAEKPLPLRSGPAPTPGTNAHHSQPLPSSGPAAVPFHATGGTAPPHPSSPRAQGLAWEGLGAKAGNEEERVRVPGITGWFPCTACLLWYP